MLIFHATDELIQTRESLLPFNLQNIIDLPARLHRKTSSTASDVFRRSPDKEKTVPASIPLHPGQTSSSSSSSYLNVMKNSSHHKSRARLQENTFSPINPECSSLMIRPPSSTSLSSTPDIPEPTAEVIDGLVGLYSTDPLYAETFASDAEKARHEEPRQQLQSALEMAKEQEVEQQEQHDEYEYGHEHELSGLRHSTDQEEGEQQPEGPQRSNSPLLRDTQSGHQYEPALFEEDSDIHLGSTSVEERADCDFNIPVCNVPLNNMYRQITIPQELEDVPEEEEEFRDDQQESEERRINILNLSLLDMSADFTDSTHNTDFVSENVGDHLTVDPVNDQFPNEWVTQSGSRHGFVALGSTKSQRRGIAIPPKPLLMIDADDDETEAENHYLPPGSPEIQEQPVTCQDSHATSESYDNTSMNSKDRPTSWEDATNYSCADAAEPTLASGEQQQNDHQLQQSRLKQYKLPLLCKEQLSPREERLSYSSVTTGGTFGRHSQVSSLTSAEASVISRYSMSYVSSADAFCADDKPDVDDASLLDTRKYHCEVGAEIFTQASNRNDKLS